MIGCPPPPSMKKTRVRAPSKTLSSRGQPPVTTTGSMPGHFGQALGEQFAAGIELVVARPVAGPAGDQDDLGRIRGRSGREREPADQSRPKLRTASRFLMIEVPLERGIGRMMAADCTNIRRGTTESRALRPAAGLADRSSSVRAAHDSHELRSARSRPAWGRGALPSGPRPGSWGTCRASS